MKWSIRILLCLCLALADAAHAAGVWLMGDADDAYHRDFVRALQLARGELDLALYPSDALPPAERAADLVITLGEKAAARAAPHSGAVLHVFITRSQFERLYAKGPPGNHSAIFLEQSLDRYVALVRAALPRVSRLILPVGTEGRSALAPLRKAAADAGLALVEQSVASPQELDALLGLADPAHDAVLFLPDPALRSNAMIKVAVMGAYKRRLPLVAYSEGLVMAGALMAVHTTVPRLAAEVTQVVDAFAARDRLPPPRNPQSFDITVNYQLALALELRLAAKPLLLEQMRHRKESTDDR